MRVQVLIRASCSQVRWNRWLASPTCIAQRRRLPARPHPATPALSTNCSPLTSGGISPGWKTLLPHNHHATTNILSSARPRLVTPTLFVDRSLFKEQWASISFENPATQCLSKRNHLANSQLSLTVLSGRSNGCAHPLGGCGVSTFAKQQTKMRVKKLEKRAD